MNTMKILLVEDAIGEQQNFIEVVDDFYKKYNLMVEPDIVEDTWSALGKIDNSYNGAIIDMLLGNDQQGGNKIVRELANLPIKVPVICVTSFPHLIQRDSLIIRERSRDDGSYESDLLLLWELYKQVDTLNIPPLTDEALMEIADALFVEYDKMEAQDAEPK